MAAAQYFEQVQKIFIAFYQRPADPAGLKYWAQRVDAAGGDFGAVIDAFAASPEAVALYGAIDATTIGTVIDQLYLALFNTIPDAAGKKFYVDGFIAGTFTAGTIALNVLNGATGDDAVAVANKVQVANDFTQQVDGRPLTDAYFGSGTGFNVTYAGDADAQAARDILKGVTFNAGSVLSPSQVTEALKTQIADATDPIQGQTGGQTFTLTIGEDSGAKFTGTAGNDTYNAAILEASGGGTADTLNSFDSLNGGEGTDTLNATISATAAAPVLTSIEVVNLRFAGDTKDVSLANATGVQTIVVEKSTTSAAGNESTVNGVGAATTLGVKNQTQGVNFDGSTATTLALNFDTVGKTDPLAAVTAAVDLGKTAASKATTLNITTNNANVKVLDTTLAAADIATTVSIAATGSNLIDLDVAEASATTVTVTGAGSVNLTAAAGLTAATKLDASGNTGGVTATVANAAKSAAVTGGDGNDSITMTTASGTDNTVSLGKGSDTLKVGTKLASFTKGVDGGDGTDTINITEGDTLTATTAKYIKNFETLDVTGAGHTTSLAKGVFDVSLNSFATVQIAGALVGDVEFKNAADTFTLNINGTAGAANGASQDKTDITKNVKVTLKDALGTTATSDAETFTLVARISDGNKDNTADGIIDAQTITVAGVENLVIDAAVTKLDGGTDATQQKASLHTVTVELTATEAETLTIKGDASVIANATSKALGVLTKVDASASTGNVTLDLTSHTQSVAYVGSAGVDTYTATAKGDTIYGGKGADVIDLTASTAAARDTLVYKLATDSQLTDTSKDGKITLGADTGFDVITKFDIGGTANSDRLDLTNFGFTGAQRGVENVTTKVTPATTDLTNIVDLFSAVAGDRGVAFTSDGTDTYVFVDANKDGNFSAADDIVIKFAGVASIGEVDINF